ncbi:carboxylesterase [Ophiobolus disseminans]|uniref:Carboxylesterase n=1 Tax=Ophiobolus disseminans TaxID=1469910 RepID=A0A6A7AFU5_9PLEO|nr:carboxylesterase [Ophiobolus disseminans]
MAGNREYTASWLELEAQLGGRLVVHGSAKEQRALFTGLVKSVAAQRPPPNENIQVSEHTVGAIPVRVYRSKDATDELVPIGIFAHGGGFVAGSLDSEDFFCREVVERVQTVIVSVDYRLAPENKAPAQLEDMLQGFQWTHDNATSFNGDANKMYTIGASAGGVLSLSAARQIALGRSTLPSTTIKGIVALVPQAYHPQNVPEKYKSDFLAYHENATNIPMIDKISVDAALEMASVDTNNVDYLVGMDPGSHKLFPPTYIATCEFDPLRDDGKILARALQEAGVSVRSAHYDGLPHCFWFLPMLHETAVFMNHTIDGLKWIISQM